MNIKNSTNKDLNKEMKILLDKLVSLNDAYTSFDRSTEKGINSKEQEVNWMKVQISKSEVLLVAFNLFVNATYSEFSKVDEATTDKCIELLKVLKYRYERANDKDLEESLFHKFVEKGIDLLATVGKHDEKEFNMKINELEEVFNEVSIMNVLEEEIYKELDEVSERINLASSMEENAFKSSARRGSNFIDQLFKRIDFGKMQKALYEKYYWSDYAVILAGVLFEKLGFVKIYDLPEDIVQLLRNALATEKELKTADARKIYPKSQEDKKRSEFAQIAIPVIEAVLSRDKEKFDASIEVFRNAFDNAMENIKTMKR